MEYLTEAWLKAATDALDQTPAGDMALRVGYDITEGPAGARSYTLVIEPERLTFVPGLVEPDATLRLSYDLAASIARNQTSAQRAFLDGDIRLAGNVTALLGSAPVLAAIDDQLAPLREATTFFEE